MLTLPPPALAEPEIEGPVASARGRTLLGRLPAFWQSALFPGDAHDSVPASRFAIPLLLLVSALLLYPCLDFRLFEPDEGRYAQIPREMLTRGDWLVPTLLDEPYLDKPPLCYWLVLLSYRMFGVAAWSARLVPALAVQATILVTYFLSRRLLGERAAFWGSLLLALSPGLASMGRMLVLDGLLTLWVTLALLSGLRAIAGRRLSRGWWATMSVALGLGVLTKGPIALVLVLVPFLAHRWLTGSRRGRFETSLLSLRLCGGRGAGGEGGTANPRQSSVFREGSCPPSPRPSPPPKPGGDGENSTSAVSNRLRTSIGWRAWGFLAFGAAAIGLPWYVAISIVHPEFASYFLWRHNVERFLTPFDHERPIWFFGPVLLMGLGPAALLVPLWLRHLVADRPADASGRTPAVGYLLLASAFCVGFFSLSGSKLPTYILPAFPPLCLALGAFVVHTGWCRNRWLRGSLAVWTIVLFVAHVVVLPKIAWERSPMNHDAATQAFLEDRSLPLFCFPRHVDSVAFYLDRTDLQVWRSKDLGDMFRAMDAYKRSVVLFGHRNSKLVLTENLPPHFRVVHVGKLGLCSVAVIERTLPPFGTPRRPPREYAY
jgi:4-amino-4-deoxy-L-arabinose transferase-like glycosyltransferase